MSFSVDLELSAVQKKLLVCKNVGLRTGVLRGLRPDKLGYVNEGNNSLAPKSDMTNGGHVPDKRDSHAEYLSPQCDAV